MVMSFIVIAVEATKQLDIHILLELPNDEDCVTVPYHESISVGLREKASTSPLWSSHPFLSRVMPSMISRTPGKQHTEEGWGWKT